MRLFHFVKDFVKQRLLLCLKHRANRTIKFEIPLSGKEQNTSHCLLLEHITKSGRRISKKQKTA